jgi:hypothetical protein
MQFFNPVNLNWSKPLTLTNRSFVCGHCSDKVASDRGYKIGEYGDGSGKQKGGVYICPNCVGPTFFPPNGTQLPSPAIGKPVDKIPAELDALYGEARRCTTSSSYTAAVLLCRKMLMNLAVSQGAKEGLKFIQYVDYLSDQGYLPPNGKHWVDHIRKRGNEATHEISVMSETDAKELLTFTEMLLRFIYEFPSMVSPPNPTA